MVVRPGDIIEVLQDYIKCDAVTGSMLRPAQRTLPGDTCLVLFVRHRDNGWWAVVLHNGQLFSTPAWDDRCRVVT